MMETRRIRFVFLLAILFSQVLSAQVKMSLSGTPVLNAGDADAMSYYRQMDENDEVCAILKVHPTNPMGSTLVLNTGGGLAPVPPPSGVTARQADGSWWFWVSPRVKNIYFTAQGYTSTQTVGVSLKAGKVYDVHLVVDASIRQIQEFSLDEMVMTLSVEPKECIVSYGTDECCNMGRQVVSDGYFQAVLKKGLYYFKVEQSYYEPYVGLYRLDEKATEQKIVLQPSFGYLKINTDPKGAEVYVDGFTRSLGQTPLVTRKLSKGTHTLHIWKENYYSEDVTVDVNGDGLEQELALVRLRPQYVDVTCLCEDEIAELTVLDAAGKQIASGSSGMRVQLNSHAVYKLEASRPHHLSQSTGITLRTQDEGGSINVNVGAPLPIYGGLQISSSPTRADVFIDGVCVGSTIYVGKVLSGVHTLELRKEGYWMEPIVVDIKENQTLQRSITLKQGSPDGTLNIDSDGYWKVVISAKNGSYYQSFNLPVSNLKLAPGAYTATIESTYKNRELVRNFTISSNKEVNLTMNPSQKNPYAHVIGLSYGLSLDTSKSSFSSSSTGSSSSSSKSDVTDWMLGVTYSYLPRWIGPSFAIYGGKNKVSNQWFYQASAGVTLGFSSAGSVGLLFATGSYVYSSMYKSGFGFGCMITKFVSCSLCYFPAFQKTQLIVGLSVPFPFE